ncbi:GNAT family N-acetyltransferase [Actinacidiphila yeochonensis]|uniref:GNAT family N-acetyltransferase n=1 Tax=Actinacidiphila yeochonensis TaxID=89050 RepID=UPI00068D82D1|nr:GNAT family N-acetyltransferase [Actinacidiphila yeochonensis]
MPDSTPPSPSAPRRHWGRELVEVAAVFAAMAAADCVADLVDHGPDGRVLLATSAAALLMAAAFHVGWARWTRHRARAAAPAVKAAVGKAAAEPEREPALWRLRTTVRDAPGSLGRVSTALAAGRVDIITLQTHPLADGTVDEFLLRAPAGLTPAALVLTVDEAGGTDTWLERADAHDLVDAPTRMLTLATRTALDPAELPLALRQLLGRCTILTSPAGHGAEAAAGAGGRGREGSDAARPTVMRLPDPSGGTITVRREHLPFTPTEFARARALVELDARLGVRLPRGREVLALPEGYEVGVRPAGPADHAAALAMHGRCSADSLAMRYHGPVGDADRYVSHLLNPRFGQSLGVRTPSGRLVALGHLLWDGSDGAGSTESEVALLVEDAWQHRGVGGLLLRKLVEMAAAAGRESVYAVTRSTNTAMVAAMRSLDLPLDFQVEESTLVITAALPAAASGRPSELPWTAVERPA